MGAYLAYPKEKDTPSRKNRKSARNKVFITNRKVVKVARLARQSRRETEYALEGE